MIDKRTIESVIDEHEHRIFTLEQDLSKLDTNVNKLSESLIKINNTIVLANGYLKGILYIIPLVGLMLGGLLSIGWLNIPTGGK